MVKVQYCDFLQIAYINGYGDNSVVTVGEVADPIVGTNEALVTIWAAGVNPVEVAMRQGFFHAELARADKPTALRR